MHELGKLQSSSERRTPSQSWTYIAGNSQTETCTAIYADSRGVCLTERFEKRRKFDGIDADSVICYGEFELQAVIRLCCRRAECNFATSCGEFDGIAE